MVDSQHVNSLTVLIFEFHFKNQMQRDNRYLFTSAGTSSLGLHGPAAEGGENPNPGAGAPGNHEAGLSGSAATMVISGRLGDRSLREILQVGNRLLSICKWSKLHENNYHTSKLLKNYCSHRNDLYGLGCL